ncbi:12577_t:CDS:1, partial [Gigaspora margarita]
VDTFIQQQQLLANRKEEVLIWISYENFANVKYLTEGGFGKIYKAEWVDGLIEHFNTKSNKPKIGI